MSNLSVFGCVAYALVPAAKGRNFDDGTVKMRFLDYHKGHRGYKLMEQGGTCVFYRTDVTFDEYNLRLSPERAGSDVEVPTVEVEVGSSGSHVSQQVEEPSRQSVDPAMVAAPVEPEPEPVVENSSPTHQRKPIVHYGVNEQLNIAEDVIASAVCAAELEEPKTMTEARKCPDANKWLQAMQEEMNSLIEHDTWSLTKLPPGQKIVGSKWVFKIKHDEHGEAARYKCRLVAQGYTQAQGIDYQDLGAFGPC